MGEKTKISWCDHTFNPWIGCTKVSTGCRHCYAETQNARFRWNGGWGKGQPRRRTSKKNWAKVLDWDRWASVEDKPRRVFCASLADVFDGEVDQEWRNDLWKLIDDTPHLEWLILTKRPEHIMDMLPKAWLISPPDHIRIGVTVEDQAAAEERIPLLLQSWGGRNFLSCEPLLGAVEISYYLSGCVEQVSDRQYVTRDMARDAGDMALEGSLYSEEEWEPTTQPIDWVIVGGESGPGCRPMNLQWARDLRYQCLSERVPFFFKQIGGHPDKFHDPAGWPEDLRIQEVPEAQA